MTTATTPAFEPAMTEICKTVIATVTDRPNITPEQRAVRQQTVADTMVSLAPHDPMEAILAGQCMIFDAMVHEAARELLRGQSEVMKLRARPQICSSAKMFLANLEKFEQLQARSGDKLADQKVAGSQPVTQAVPRTEPAAQPEQRRQPVPPAARLPAPTQPTQPRPAAPFAAERELAQVLAGRGQTGAKVDEALAAAWRDSLRAGNAPPLTGQGRPPVGDGAAIALPAEPAVGGSGFFRQKAKVDELV